MKNPALRKVAHASLPISLEITPSGQVRVIIKGKLAAELAEAPKPTPVTDPTALRDLREHGFNPTEYKAIGPHAAVSNATFAWILSQFPPLRAQDPAKFAAVATAQNAALKAPAQDRPSDASVHSSHHR
jgi:hypothetical protein